MLDTNGQRMLAYIVNIDAITPIEGADNIELAHVGGWSIVVKKQEFEVGGKGVYFEIDSQVPEQPRFEFLRKKKFAVKTMKLGKFGVISQGLLMPMSEFPELEGYEIGADCTKILGVKYYEPIDNARKAGKVKPSAKYQSMVARHPHIFKKKWACWMMKREWGRRIMFFFFGRKKDNPKGFPTRFPFIHVTDEERIENCVWRLQSKEPLIATEKLDGTSTTFIMERVGRNKFEFTVYSRHVRQFSETQECFHEYNIYWAMANKYNVETHLRQYLEENPELTYVCLQGESVGKVQGNPLKLAEDDFYGFNFIRSDVGRISSTSAKKLIESWGMKWVPIINTNWVNPDTIEEMKALADGQSVVNPKVLREGLVYRSETDSTVSFKNVSNKYLLKHSG